MSSIREGLENVDTWNKDTKNKLLAEFDDKTHRIKKIRKKTAASKSSSRRKADNWWSRNKI